MWEAFKFHNTEYTSYTAVLSSLYSLGGISIQTGAKTGESELDVRKQNIGFHVKFHSSFFLIIINCARQCYDLRKKCNWPYSVIKCSQTEFTDSLVNMTGFRFKFYSNLFIIYIINLFSAVLWCTKTV